MLLKQFNVQSQVKICTHAIQWEHTYESPTVVPTGSREHYEDRLKIH